MPPALVLLRSGSLRGRLRFPSYFHLVRLLFHPLVQLRLLEAPAIAQFESRNLLLVDVLIERVRTHPQVLRSLANVHHFSRVGHRVHAPSTESTPPLAGVSGRKGKPWEEISRSSSCSRGFRCAEHISTPENTKSSQISAFYPVLYLFSGKLLSYTCRLLLWLVVHYLMTTIRRAGYSQEAPLPLHT